MPAIHASRVLNEVRYEIRGSLAHRAEELERLGRQVLRLNIGNPGRFGFRTPATLSSAVAAGLSASEAYCHQKGLLPAREAVAAQALSLGINADPERVFIGNGVSELIDLALRALLEPGDEVLIPSPDYPLWTAAVTLNSGRAVHYPCHLDQQFVPDPDELEALITERTRALVLINPNNPTGAVYPQAVVRRLVEIAERHRLVLMSDEIYDRILFDQAPFRAAATYPGDLLCLSFGGLSKVHRACGYRVGWLVASGAVQRAQAYLNGLELLAALRLCSNVPAQWAVVPALVDDSIDELVQPGGRLYETRRAVVDGCAASPWLDLVSPQGALYAFPTVRKDQLPQFDDERFAHDLLEQESVLLAPGYSFNTPRKDQFRLTLLPEAPVMREVFRRIDSLLSRQAESARAARCAVG